MSTFNIPWRMTAFSVLLGSATFFGTNTYANTPEPPGLFSTLPGKSRAELPEQAIDGRSRAVKINHGQLRSGRFFVNLPGGVSFEAVRDQMQDLGQNRSAWIGHASDNPGNRVVIGISGDAVAGTFAYQDRLFKLEPRADGSHMLSEVKTGDPAPELDPIPVADTTGSGSADSVDAVAADGGAVIDVLVAYTPKIESIYGASGADALSIQAVAETNQAYANSGMSPRLNLVHSVLTNYTESGSMKTDLSRLRGTSDGYMDELHTLRDSYGADLVSLIEHEPQYCGYAYRMTSLSAGFASSAFSVVHRTCATGYYSFAHELGHNQGAHHDPANASGAIYAYAYGHQDPYGAFRTVMAYNCSGGCTRVDHFSNPDILYNSATTGAMNASDNARAIDTTAATVASFRQQSAQNPPSAPYSLTGAATSHNTIDLDWADTSADESGFKLERSDNGVNFSQVASLPANTRSYLDDNLLADTLYNYRVRSWNSAGNSGYSDVAVAATEPTPTASPPRAPTTLSASTTGTDRININWSDMSNNEDGFIVERRTDGSAQWRQIKTTGSNASAYTDAGLQAATLYHYRVHAFNGGGTSASTASDSARTDEQLGADINLSASGSKVKGRKTAQLTWSGAQSSKVDIYREGSLLAGAVANSGAYTDKIGRRGGGGYVYKVCEASSAACSNTTSVVF